MANVDLSHKKEAPRTAYRRIPASNMISDQLLEQRRRSIAGSINPAVQHINIMEMPEALIKESGWEAASSTGLVDLALSFIVVVTNSSINIYDHVRVWFDRSIPEEGMSKSAREVRRAGRGAKRRAEVG